MGKNTLKNRKKKQAKLRKRQAGKLNVESLSIEVLLATAQEKIDTFNFESAQELCQEALKRDPDNILALETSASLCIEVGNFDGAKHCLGRAITLQPEDGHMKYMSMAQLMTGKDSLHCYQKGLSILKGCISSFKENISKKETSNDSNLTTLSKASLVTEGMSGPTNSEIKPTTEDEGCEDISEMDGEDKEKVEQNSSSQLNPNSTLQSLKRQISTAYCSIAELYMTDLCDEEEAEVQCKIHITEAIEADPVNPEAYQNMASFLLVKQDSEQAKVYITKSLEIWLPKFREVDEGKAVAGSFDPVEVCPLSYSTRLSAARILIEVEDYKNAIEVLEGLAEEDDEVINTWYLLGLTYYLQGEEFKEAAKYHLHRALQVNNSVPCEDEQLLEHLKELMDELGPYDEEETTTAADDGIEQEIELDSEEEESMDTN